jgi:hypothetical protein
LNSGFNGSSLSDSQQSVAGQGFVAVFASCMYTRT